MTGAGSASGPAHRPRLLLVNPCCQELGWDRYFQLAPLTLLQVAACVPEPWEVTVADETLDAVPEDGGFDLVGITCMTHQAPRTYALADRLRARGTRVVLGGIHPTVLPQEAGAHADAVVVGEAEPVLGRLLQDALEGRLAPVYTSPEPSGDILEIPPARREILGKRRYLTRQVLQTTRGCPYDCPFCTVTPYFGRRFRHRPTADVLAEVATLPRKLMIFLDDDVLAQRAHAMELLRGLAPLGKRWASQATLKCAEDADLLKMVVDSGCLGLFVGVESVPHSSNSPMAKTRGIADVGEALKRLLDAGIIVEGSFVFGFDHDDEGVFERTVRFVEEIGLSNATFHLLTPYPGTALARQFEAEGRLLHKDWSRYDHNTVVFRPRGMTPEALYRGWLEARKAVHSWGSIFSRVGRNPHNRFTNFAYNVLRRAPDTRMEFGADAPSGDPAPDR